MTATPSVASLLDLSGRTAIVTGASGGIGAGIARRFGEAGANVVCHYNCKSRERAKRVAEAIRYGRRQGPFPARPTSRRGKGAADLRSRRPWPNSVAPTSWSTMPASSRCRCLPTWRRATGTP